MTYRLTHPQLLDALARAGHGSTVLIADANYAHSTGGAPAAERVHLNLRPGLLTTDQVLEVLLDAIPVEAAATMVGPDGQDSPAITGFAATLEAATQGEVPFERLQREPFRAAARSADLAVLIATGDTRHYANLLLTIGALPGT